MKLRLPKPEKLTLEGEKETPPPVYHTPDNGNVTSFHPKVKTWYEGGYFPRAVVVRSFHQGTHKLDPENWGIITKMAPDQPFGLCVAWTDGRTTWHTSTELDIIYPGMTTNECRVYLFEGKH